MYNELQQNWSSNVRQEGRISNESTLCRHLHLSRNVNFRIPGISRAIHLSSATRPSTSRHMLPLDDHISQSLVIMKSMNLISLRKSCSVNIITFITFITKVTQHLKHRNNYREHIMITDLTFTAQRRLDGHNTSLLNFFNRC